MASGVGGLHGRQRAGAAFSIGGEVPTSTHLAMADGSCGELWRHFTIGGGCIVLVFWQGGAPKCAKRKLCLALLVSAMSTPLGVDSIVEGVVVATWGSPSRSSVVESFVVVVLQ
jgi:hypothetical protein